MNNNIQTILERQERDRQQGKKVAGVLGLIIIVPILLVTVFAVMIVASA